MKKRNQHSFFTMLKGVMGIAVMLHTHASFAHGSPEVDNVPERVVKATITQQPDITGLHAMILDAPRPGIMLRYQGNDTLTVLGSDGSAFLRFTKSQVQGNVNSNEWQHLPNIPKGLTANDEGWVTLSESGSYAWLDARLNALHDAQHAPTAPKDWTIAIARQDEPRTKVQGQLQFKQF